MLVQFSDPVSRYLFYYYYYYIASAVVDSIV